MELKVSTHTGQDFTVNVDTYNASEMNIKLNDASLNTVEIGGVIISRIDVKSILPIQSTESALVEPTV